MNESEPLRPEDVERVRFQGEASYAAALEAGGALAALGDLVAGEEPERVRRHLMARSLRLTEGMAPGPYEAAHACARRFGVTAPIELYQAAGAENAAMHHVESPVLLEIQGRLLSLLDGPTTLAVVGHELGHYLAHGRDNPHGRASLAAAAILAGVGMPSGLEHAASRLSMAQEVTADRFGLLACSDLQAALRLEMIATTGLSAEALTWDTDAYLAQCRELMDQTLASGGAVMGVTHPEHSLRAWAVWLFAETDVFLALAGVGPGTRTLASVDALILQALGQHTAPLRDVTTLDGPLQEVHECGLAACVLVALADGELHDSELATIERVFAPLVPDWRAVLNRDNALERFHDTGAVVAAAGPKTQRALFALLLHVMATDGELREAEATMVMAIGDALGCGTLFRALLVAALRTFEGVTPDLDTVQPLPLPARKDEARTALALFLDGVARRGGGDVTLRRLLRLLGEQAADAAAVALVVRAIADAGLTVSPAPGDSLDALLHLEATPETATRREPAPPPPRRETGPERDRLRRALARLRDQLVSGDGRSPAIRLYAPRTGRSFDLAALDGISTGLSERALALVRARKPARLVDASEIGRHEGARAVAAELLALEREHRARVDDTGARDLHVGAPFLTGTVSSYLFRGPLVLTPVELARDDRGARSFSLVPHRDDPPVANQSLLRLLFHRKGFSFPDDLADRLDELAAEGPEALIAELSRLGLGRLTLSGALGPLRERSEEILGWRGDRFELEECAILGLFPQSSSDLLQDYDGLLADLADPDADPSRVLGCALELLPADLRAALRPEAPAPPPASPLLPVSYADPSQRAVLDRARSARALVVDGPPGTGKSQIIVNMVADALGRGERVAVVCEKRAALDVVVQRLEGLGLRHLLALVHDVHDDRRGLYGQVAARLEEATPRTFDSARAARVAQEAAQLTEALAARSAALAHRPAMLSVGELHTLAAGLDGPVLEGAWTEALAALDARAVEDVVAALRPLRTSADLWADGSPLRAPVAPAADAPGDGPRRRPVEGPGDVEAAKSAVAAALATARVFEQAMAAVPPEHQAALAPARAALEAVRTSRDARADADAREVFAAVLEEGGRSRQALDAVAAADAAFAEGAEALARFGGRVSFEPGAPLEAALAVATRWAGRFWRLFVLGWWRARAQVRAALAAQWPERAADSVDAGLLADVRARISASRAWKVADDAAGALGLRSALGTAFASARAFVERAAAAHRRVRPLLAARPQLEAAGAWPTGPAALDAWDQQTDARIAALDAEAAHRAAAAPVRAAFPWLPELPTAALLGPLHAAVARDGHRLPAADRQIATARAVFDDADRALEALATALPDGTVAAWADAVRKTWAEAALAAVERSHPDVRALDAPTAHGDEEAAAQRLRALHDDGARYEVERIVAQRDQTALLRTAAADAGKRRTADQAAREGMLKDAKKQRYILPLRSFVRRYAPSGLVDVLPVWLLSPETMAVLFPREPLFDLIIIDEASQCTVESGLPVLIRGHRAVIAGDEQQMPPTSFFQAVIESEDDAVRTEAADMLDAESLLVLARSRVDRAGLLWHYRCIYEELIAFSNHAMYGGGLHTIPSTVSRSAPPALRYLHVEDGAYDKGANPVEAERVVSVVEELLARPDAPTVGVVTFNLQQRRAILDAIDARQSDATFAERWGRAVNRERLDERPFVKNLESVQGDERDVIVFSLGHAPVERPRRDGKVERWVPARFGPLGLRGGSRRLNVAISRAKRECIVVASFEPALLSVARSQNEGPKLLKQFLEFAWHLSAGRRAQADRVLDLVRSGDAGPADRQRRRDHLPESYVPLAAQLVLALQKEGLACEVDVGTSGFRVPLAVVSPASPDRYALGILCDEGDHAADPFQRHVHTPTVLTARGWRLLRVTGREWHRRPDAVLAAVRAEVGAEVAAVTAAPMGSGQAS